MNASTPYWLVSLMPKQFCAMKANSPVPLELTPKQLLAMLESNPVPLELFPPQLLAAPANSPWLPPLLTPTQSDAVFELMPMSPHSRATHFVTLQATMP